MGQSKKRMIFTPLDIGTVRIKNRIAMAPMAIFGIMNPDGTFNQRVLDYFIERAKGGVGLIISTCFKVENEIEPIVPAFPVLSPTSLAPLAELAETLHSLGTKLFVQLSPGLGQVAAPVFLAGQPVAATEGPNFWNPDLTCRELSAQEVEAIVSAFGGAAELLVAAGVDGIELHGHEGYLFDQFTTSLWNKRTDKYGGKLENRLRFPIEVLQEIRRKVGDALAVEYRYGLKHYVKGPYSGGVPDEEFAEVGRDMNEGLKMAKMFEEAGFDALHVDAGCYDSWYWAHPPNYLAPGCMADLTEAAKKAVDVPIIGVGRLDVPEVAVQVVERGKMDVVAIGRGLLADAFWAKKLEEGRPQDIRPCTACHDGCLNRIFEGKPLSCSVNPATGREGVYALGRSDKSKKIMVIGGGLAGLEAARAASLRGHKVQLYERSGDLGGHLIEASVPQFKEDLRRLLTWYETQLQNLGVEARLQNEVTADLVAQESPDAVIIATGSDPIIPEIPGIKADNAVTVVDLLRGQADAGDNVALIGGGLVGCETALWLAQQGRKVSIVEVLPELMVGGVPVPYPNKVLLMDLLRFNQIEILANHTPSEINGGEVILVDNKDSRQKKIGFETLAFAVGFTPNRKLYDELIGSTPNLYLVGDAREPRNVMGAVWDAYEVARTI
jgi:2-enoate reductase